jgi:hypothetical protein
MAFNPKFANHDDLYELTKIYLFGKPFKGLSYDREDLAGSEHNIGGAAGATVKKRIDMPPQEPEATYLRDRIDKPRVSPEFMHFPTKDTTINCRAPWFIWSGARGKILKATIITAVIGACPLSKP